MRPLNPKERSYLVQMLGCWSEIPPKQRGYRNHYYVMQRGSPREQELKDMENQGWVKTFCHLENGTVFEATEKGRNAIGLSEAQYRRAQAGHY